MSRSRECCAVEHQSTSRTPSRGHVRLPPRHQSSCLVLLGLMTKKVPKGCCGRASACLLTLLLGPCTLHHARRSPSLAIIMCQLARASEPPTAARPQKRKKQCQTRKPLRTVTGTQAHVSEEGGDFGLHLAGVGGASTLHGSRRGAGRGRGSFGCTETERNFSCASKKLYRSASDARPMHETREPETKRKHQGEQRSRTQRLRKRRTRHLSALSVSPVTAPCLSRPGQVRRARLTS